MTDFRLGFAEMLGQMGINLVSKKKRKKEMEKWKRGTIWGEKKGTEKP